MRLFKLKRCKRVHGVYFAPAGNPILVVGGQEASMIDCGVWLDPISGRQLSRFERSANSFAVTASCDRILVAGCNHFHDQAAPLEWAALPEPGEWHAIRDATPKSRSLRPELQHIMGLAINPADTLFAAGQGFLYPRARDYVSEYELFLFQALPPQLIRKIPLGDSAHTISFSCDSTRIAYSGGPYGRPEVTVLEGASGRIVYRYLPPGTRSRCLRFLPDGQLAVANARRVYLLPANSAEPRVTLAGHKGQINAMAVSSEGRRLITASHDGMIGVWDTATGATVTTFDWRIGPITAVAFSPDGLTCAAAGEKGQVVVWDVDE